MRSLIVLLLVAAVSAKAPLLKNSEPIPGKYIVKLKDGFNLDDAIAQVSVSGGLVDHIYRHVLHGFAAELLHNVLNIVLNLDAVEYVEEDGIYRASVGSWGLDRIDQRHLPLNNSFTPRGNGSGYNVWVIDSGIRASHIEFGGRAEQVKNYAGGVNGDCNGHGTHCSGIVGSVNYGVATGVNIKGIKVLNCLGVGATKDILKGCDYVYANGGSNSIASMSLEGDNSTSIDNAVNAMVIAGIPTAVAAGNDNTTACNSSPARAANATTVAATDIFDRRSTYSNYGGCVNIFAPGDDITSTWHTSNTATNTLSGTSTACPHVAGGIALYGKSVSATIAAGTFGQILHVGLNSPNIFLYVGL